MPLLMLRHDWRGPRGTVIMIMQISQRPTCQNCNVTRHEQISARQFKITGYNMRLKNNNRSTNMFECIHSFPYRQTDSLARARARTHIRTHARTHTRHQTRAHTHTRTARTHGHTHAHTHARARARTHARTHGRIHTHTHTRTHTTYTHTHTHTRGTHGQRQVEQDSGGR